MARIKKYPAVWKGTVFALVFFCVVASPLSVSLENPLSLKINVASADLLDTSQLPGWLQAWLLLNPVTGPIIAGNKVGSAVADAVTSCALLPGDGFFVNCIWNPAATSIGQLFLTLGGWFLKFAGVIFDVLVQHTLIAFGDTITTKIPIMGAITAGWTVFRDFANILIIGIFTFIAISIILGLEQFGQKKMIGRVLVIAVLINFSLLFTQMIIDASNFTAYAIYAQMATTQGSAATTGTAASGSFDIAQAFLNPIGITSVWNDSGQAVAGVLKATNSGAQALVFGLVGGLLLFAVGIVLFYGCFLIASRTILLIFLMLTSAIAFATYLVPGLATGAYGWGAWWKSLINAAVFAPLLMVFLSISLAIINAAGKITVPIGSIDGNPQQALSGNGWVTIMLYLIGIGTLFVSFKLSSSFAGKIAGFNMASLLPGTALGLAGVATGILGRNLIGGPASAGLTALRQKAFGGGHYDEDGKWVAGTGGYNAINRFAAKRIVGLQGASFNPLKTGAGGVFAGAVGTPKGLIGSKLGEGGYEGVMARKAKAADELARKIGPTEGQKVAARQSDEAQERERRRREREIETRRRDENQRLLDAFNGAEEQAKKEQPEREKIEEDLKKAVDTAMKGSDAKNNPHYEEYAAATKDRDDKEREHEIRKTSQEAAEELMKKAIEEATLANDPAKAAVIGRQMRTSSEGQRESELRHEKDRTERALNITRLEHVITQGDESVQKIFKERQKLDEEAAQKGNAAVGRAPQAKTPRQEVDEANRNLRRLGDDNDIRNAAQRYAQTREKQRHVDLGTALLWDKRAAPKLEGQLKAHERRQLVADLNAIQKAEGSGGAPTAPRAAPPSAPQGGH
jgi:hypothetical protein